MWSQIRPALFSLFWLTVVTGVVYPVLVTGIAQAVFPHQANGSLISDEQGRVIGSELIGQAFTGPQYFHSRPSATGPFVYNAAASSGSNLGPTNSALTDAVKERVAQARQDRKNAEEPVPVDLVTASASGLDPHLSPAAALYQAERVAVARGLSEQRVRELVEQHIEPRTLGLLGEPRVNVLRLNLALNKLAAAAPPLKESP